MAVGHYATIGGGVHSVWLDHGFAKLDVPFGCRLGYTIGMSALKVSNLGGLEVSCVLRPILSILH